MVKNFRGGRIVFLIAQWLHFSSHIGLSKIVPAASVKRL